jgi:hypothetical protein
MGLDSCYVTSSCLCHPYHYYGYLTLVVWRIGFGVTEMELVGVMMTVQGLSGAMLEACGYLSYPKSKDRFMERPPMKTVKP